MISCSRYHDISVGHRVYGHEGKCRFLHGHNYRIHFTCEANSLDTIGRVIDFSCIKHLLCDWLEQNWDHKFLIWDKDPLCSYLKEIDPSVVFTPFNPTAENMAEYLLHDVASKQLEDTVATLVKVKVEETRKCYAEAKL